MTAEPSCGLIGTNGLFREPVSTRPRTPSRRCAPRNADIGWPVGGTLTGRGGDIIIIDDPIKPQDAQSKSVREKTVQWYENTLLSRLDDKVHGAIVVVMRRRWREPAAIAADANQTWHPSARVRARESKVSRVRFVRARRGSKFLFDYVPRVSLADLLGREILIMSR